MDMRGAYYGLMGPLSLPQTFTPVGPIPPGLVAAYQHGNINPFIAAGGFPRKFCPIPPHTPIPYIPGFRPVNSISEASTSQQQHQEARTPPPRLQSMLQVPSASKMRLEQLQIHPSFRYPPHLSPKMPPSTSAVTSTSPKQHPADTATFQAMEFSKDDLDMVLYGYARSKNIQMQKKKPAKTGVALSGLRIGELSYSIDRILGQTSPKAASSNSAHPSAIDTPEGLEFKESTFAGMIHHGIFCKKSVITKGTRFGPFQGKRVNTSEIKTNDDNSFMWEIFQDGKLSHFIDGRGSSGNWMAQVNCARYAQEQNLTALQVNGEIFYEACKDITEGTELLVWYGDMYMQFMGIPICMKEPAENKIKSAPDTDQTDSEGFTCERCGKVFAYEYYRDKHLKYTRCVDQGNRKFPCHLCTRSFEKRDRLRIHILHVHEKHRPHKCHVCGKSFSQSSSLNKHMRVHSGERPYKCVYCSKAFTASSILRTHIRQHSGEKPFKCKHCGKAFASHAAHDSHVRRTHAKDKMAVAVAPAEAEEHIDVVGYV